MSETQVEERPILFSAPMVNALLQGRKTQARRIVKPQPYTLRTEGFGYPTKRGGFVSLQSEHCLNECPYGKLGDRLWVRETWASAYQNGCWGTAFLADMSFAQGKRQHPKGPHFHAKELGDHVRWRPSIHMPRWASRITLEITEVPVSRGGSWELSNLELICQACNKRKGAFSADEYLRLNDWLARPENAYLRAEVMKRLEDAANGSRERFWRNKKSKERAA